LSIRLYILGTLAKGSTHPYMIKKKLIQSMPSTTFSEGKFYYNFEVLQNKKYIEAVEVIQEGNRPEKTLYAITEEGLSYLEQEIYNSFKKSIKVQDLYISIYLLEFIDNNKAAHILEAAIHKEKKRMEKVEELKANHPAIDEFESFSKKKQAAVRFIADHSYHVHQLNMEWLEKLLLMIKSQS
jgi:DNA-binding PadR family transcriptional regulator